MEENKTMEEVQAPAKMPYEELEALAVELNNKVMSLYGELQNTNVTAAYIKLEMLFKVLKYKENFSADFIQMCISDIEEMLTPETQKAESDKE